MHTNSFDRRQHPGSRRIGRFNCQHALAIICVQLKPIFDASATDRWYMVLPEDKFVILMRYLKNWADATIRCLSLAATRTARGFLLSISEAFAIGKADVAHVTHMQTAGEALARRMPRVPCEAVMVPKSAEALGAFGFWATEGAYVSSNWDRAAPGKLLGGLMHLRTGDVEVSCS